MAVAEGILTWIATDTAIPEPTDAAPPKWIAYGVLGGGAVAWIALTDDESDENVIPFPGSETKADADTQCEPYSDDDCQLLLEDLNRWYDAILAHILAGGGEEVRFMIKAYESAAKTACVVCPEICPQIPRF